MDFAEDTKEEMAWAVESLDGYVSELARLGKSSGSEASDDARAELLCNGISVFLLSLYPAELSVFFDDSTGWSVFDGTGEIEADPLGPADWTAQQVVDGLVDHLNRYQSAQP
ncbi:MAG: hypothetical protein JWN95_487 [Frankiales bacterium]|nr:hypothetical protein [Frankiales bacterium]